MTPFFVLVSIPFKTAIRDPWQLRETGKRCALLPTCTWDCAQAVFHLQRDCRTGGYKGKLANRENASMKRISRATASRELTDLVCRGDSESHSLDAGITSSYDIDWVALEADF